MDNIYGKRHVTLAEFVANWGNNKGAAMMGWNRTLMSRRVNSGREYFVEVDSGWRPISWHERRGVGRESNERGWMNNLESV